MTAPEIGRLLPKHNEALTATRNLPPFKPATLPQKTLSAKVGEYFSRLEQTPVMMQANVVP